MQQIIRYSGWYSEELCQQHPTLVFIFGDNVRGVGRGGQAIIRYEPNAFGVPTKRVGSMAPGSFFQEGNLTDRNSVIDALNKIEDMLDGGSQIVVPVTAESEISLGLERARLKEVAPSLYAIIKERFEAFADSYGGRDAEEAKQLVLAD